MKVYIITAFTAEQYEDHTWVDSVWSTKESAEAYLKEHAGLIRSTEDDDDYGFYLFEDIDEYEVR